MELLSRKLDSTEQQDEKRSVKNQKIWYTIAVCICCTAEVHVYATDYLQNHPKMSLRYIVIKTSMANGRVHSLQGMVLGLYGPSLTDLAELLNCSFTEISYSSIGRGVAYCIAAILCE